MRRPYSFLALWIILSETLLVHSAFESSFCWASNCVRNEGNRTCYRPGPSNLVFSNSCNGGHFNSPDYQFVLDKHLKQGQSITYHTKDTNQLLGGANYTVPPNTAVKICLSGRVLNNGAYQTLCIFAESDNTLDIPGPYCQVGLGQNFVTDGCYQLDNATNSSSSPPSSTSSTANSSSLSSPPPDSSSLNGAVIIGLSTSLGVAVLVLATVLGLVVKESKSIGRGTTEVRGDGGSASI